MAPPDEIAIGHGRIALRKMTMIEKIEDPAAFRALRNEWDDLLEASSANSFFLTWEWLYPCSTGRENRASWVASSCTRRGAEHCFTNEPES